MCFARCFAILLVLLVAAPVRAFDGTLDPEFGSIIGKPGRTVVGIDLSSNPFDEALGAVELPDGSTIVVGTARNGSVASPFNPLTIVMVKLDARGIRDLRFGPTNGRVVLAFPPVQAVHRVLTRRDAGGKASRIVVLATRASGAPGSAFPEDTDPLILQFNLDGTLDNAFGPGGTANVFLDAPGSDRADTAADMAFDPQGRLVVLSTISRGTGLFPPTDFALVRLDTAGRFDPTFGNGTVLPDATVVSFDSPSTQVDTANTLLLLPDGRIVIAGTTKLLADNRSDVFRLARVLADGKGLETTIPGGSAAFVCDRLASAHVAGLALEPDGNVLMFGTTFSTSGAFPSEICVARLSRTGIVSLPLSDAKLRPPAIDGNLLARSIGFAKDGTLLLGFTGCNGADCDFLLQRQPFSTAFGNLGGNQRVTFDLGGNRFDDLRAVVPISRERLLMLGTAKAQNDSLSDHDYAIARVLLNDLLVDGFED